MGSRDAVQLLQRFEQTPTNLADTPDRVDTMLNSKFKGYSQTDEPMDGKQSRGIDIDLVVQLGENRDGEDGFEQYGCP